MRLIKRPKQHVPKVLETKPILSTVRELEKRGLLPAALAKAGDMGCPGCIILVTRGGKGLCDSCLRKELNTEVAKSIGGIPLDKVEGKNNLSGMQVANSSKKYFKTQADGTISELPTMPRAKRKKKK